ncbi:hypothetical protein ASD86_19090 [Lysobacter sp. Root690]|nr:hypothetical protein ASD86_19090 [Lysobacter sp. Root690]
MSVDISAGGGRCKGWLGAGFGIGDSGLGEALGIGNRESGIGNRKEHDAIGCHSVGARFQLLLVIPAKAGIQRLQSHVAVKPWMFGFAEMKRGPSSRE